MPFDQTRMDQMRDWSHMISRYLGSFPSLLYAFIYVCLIPLFALIYYFLPDQFYYSTPLYDQETYRDFPILCGELKRCLIEAHQRSSHTTKFAADGYHYDLNTLEIDRATNQMDPRSELDFIFKLDSELWAAEGVGHGKCWAIIRIDLEWFFTSNYSMPSDPLPTKPSRIPFSEGAMVLGVRGVLPKHFVAQLFLTDNAAINEIFGDQLVLPASNTALKILQDYLVTTNGISRGRNNPFGRMLYLSVVTITTVGFGDIVPMTQLTRALVASEAFAGIILIGLFLNALGFERGNRL